MKVGIFPPTKAKSGAHWRYVQSTLRGQITLPIGIRRSLAIDPSTLLDVSVERGRIVLSPVRSTVSGEQLRRYSDAEVQAFLVDDQLTVDDQRFVQKLLKR